MKSILTQAEAKEIAALPKNEDQSDLINESFELADGIRYLAEITHDVKRRAKLLEKAESVEDAIRARGLS